MAKKSDFTVATEALASVKSYNETIANCEKFLADPELDPSLKVTLTASMKMATENRDSAVGTIFRRVAEHVGSDEKALVAFVTKIFPAIPAT